MKNKPSDHIENSKQLDILTSSLSKLTIKERELLCNSSVMNIVKMDYVFREIKAHPCLLPSQFSHADLEKDIVMLTMIRDHIKNIINNINNIKKVIKKYGK
jgi:hypothetical protein